jgi:ComF family protein
VALLLRPAPVVLPPPPIGAAGAAGPFEGALRDAIHRLKYAHHGELAGSLGRLLAASVPRALPALTPEGASDVVVVPVPLYPARLVARGFNPAARLAAEVAAALGAPLAARAVARVRDTPAQAGLDAAARRANVRGAFGVTRAADVAGRRCLLVDDVVTTGATAAACAAALLDAGGREVLLLALARAELTGTSAP